MCIFSLIEPHNIRDLFFCFLHFPMLAINSDFYNIDFLEMLLSHCIVCFTKRTIQSIPRYFKSAICIITLKFIATDLVRVLAAYSKGSWCPLPTQPPSISRSIGLILIKLTLTVKHSSEFTLVIIPCRP